MWMMWVKLPNCLHDMASSDLCSSKNKITILCHYYPWLRQSQLWGLLHSLTCTCARFKLLVGLYGLAYNNYDNDLLSKIHVFTLFLRLLSNVSNNSKLFCMCWIILVFISFVFLPKALNYLCY